MVMELTTKNKEIEGLRQEVAKLPDLCLNESDMYQMNTCQTAWEGYCNFNCQRQVHTLSGSVWGIEPVTALIHLGLAYWRDPMQRGLSPRYSVSSAFRKDTLSSTAHRRHPSIVTRVVGVVCKSRCE